MGRHSDILPALGSITYGVPSIQRCMADFFSVVGGSTFLQGRHQNAGYSVVVKYLQLVLASQHDTHFTKLRGPWTLLWICVDGFRNMNTFFMECAQLLNPRMWLQGPARVHREPSTEWVPQSWGQAWINCVFTAAGSTDNHP